MVNKKTKLSIIITYYKTYELTLKLLEELRKQKNNDVEIILVDDGCNELRLDQFQDVTNIIHLEKNGGYAHALNTALKCVNGKYVAFIDSDDMIAENYIEVLLKAINEHDEDEIFFDWQDINTGEIVHHPGNYAVWKAIYKKEIIPKFDESWKYSADVPFQHDLRKIKHTKFYLDDIIYLYNSGRQGSLTVEKERLRKLNMIKCEVIKDFTLQKFEDLEEIERRKVDLKGKLFVGDTFKCDKELADYLMGNNPKGEVVIKLIEVIPEDKKEVKEEHKEEHIEQHKETKSKKQTKKKK